MSHDKDYQEDRGLQNNLIEAQNLFGLQQSFGPIAEEEDTPTLGEALE